MRALALALLVSSTAFAQEEDAPVIETEAPIITPAPAPDLCLNETDRIRLARRLVALEKENAENKKTVEGGLPAWVLIVAGVVVLGAGVGIGYGVSKALPSK